MAIKDRATLLTQRDTLQADNTSGDISPADVRGPGKDEIESMLLPEDYQSAGLYVPVDTGGVLELVGTGFAPWGLTWEEQVAPLGAATQDPGAGTMTLGVRGRYQVHFDMVVELNESDTLIMTWFTNINGGGFTQSTAGTLIKFRRNQIDLGSASIDAVFDVDVTESPVILQPRFRMDGSAEAIQILNANMDIQGWGRTDDAVPGLRVAP